MRVEKKSTYLLELNEEEMEILAIATYSVINELPHEMGQVAAIMANLLSQARGLSSGKVEL